VKPLFRQGKLFVGAEARLRQAGSDPLKKHLFGGLPLYLQLEAETQTDILASHWATVSTGVFIQHKCGCVCGG
jgi:hypothetical protein